MADRTAPAAAREGEAWTPERRALLAQRLAALPCVDQIEAMKELAIDLDRMVADARAERDRDRDAAAELRRALERVRNEELATVEDYVAAGIDPSESTDAIVIVTAALARIDGVGAAA